MTPYQRAGCLVQQATARQGRLCAGLFVGQLADSGAGDKIRSASSRLV